MGKSGEDGAKEKAIILALEKPRYMRRTFEVATLNVALCRLRGRNNPISEVA